MSHVPVMPADFRPLSCGECARGIGLGFEFSAAFQPIVNLDAGSVFAYEALVRGPAGEPAGDVLRQVNDSNRYRFDQACRVKIIELAAALDAPVPVHINFFPRAVYRPELCIRTTLEAAQEHGFPIERITFEVTEGERADQHAHLINVLSYYKSLGFRTAIDDFGAGYSGLELLVQFQPDFIKLDMALIRDVDSHAPRQAVVRSLITMARDLGITVIAEGIETAAEAAFLADSGIFLMQGYWFARPAFERLPEATFAAAHV